jgi:pimeloyl-ACP methyl ester carboxylesterase
MMNEKTYLGHNPAGFHRIAYTQWGEATGMAPVVCVHGLTRNGRDFDYLARQLATMTQVYCPDMPGRGRSEWLPESAFYNYPQYMSDVTTLIARSGASRIDWIGTSMGGILGMLLAAEPNSPIRRLIVNDVGPFIPAMALKRIGMYISDPQTFASVAEVDRYLRKTYASFGRLSEEEWAHLARHATRSFPDGRLGLAYDPKIADPFKAVQKDVDFWAAYDRIKCPVMVLHGMNSDVLPSEVAQEMTRRGPHARLVELPHIGHAPALMDATQIALISEFLSL